MLSDRLVIYELQSDDETDMNYKLKEKIQQQPQCSLLSVTSQHLLFCEVLSSLPAYAPASQ